jgi:hypothetical protein
MEGGGTDPLTFHAATYSGRIRPTPPSSAGPQLAERFNRLWYILICVDMYEVA